jgi:hypothetical protein
MRGIAPARSNATRSTGTERANSAMLEPPEPIHPSASDAARRTASGCPTPIHIGSGVCTGFSGMVPPSN